MQRALAGLFLVLFLPLEACRAQDAPTVVLRARSFDALQGQGRILLDQLGLGAAADRLVTQIKTRSGPRGLEGLDAGRPIGLFLHFNPDPAGALLVPVASEKGFLDLLQRLDIRPERDAEGIYSFRVGLVIDVSMKFAGNYAWVTALNRNAFRTSFDAEKVLGSTGPLLFGRVRIDGIPKDARQMALAEFEQRMQEASKMATAGSPGQQALVSSIYQSFTKAFAQVLEEGKDLTLEADLDATKNEVHAQVKLQPREGTELARTFADKRTSVFPGKSSASQAFLGRVNVTLPPAVAKGITQFVEDAFQDAESRLSDPGRKKKAQSLLAALKPTLEAGELDAQLRLLGPAADGKLGFVLGLKTRQGDALGKTIRELVDESLKQMSPAERTKVHLDADAVGGMKIHRFDLPAEDASVQRAQNLLGDPTLSVAFRSDAILFGLGADSLAGLKELASGKGGGGEPVVSLEIDAARLAGVLASKGKSANPAEYFKSPADSRVRFAVEGGSDLRLSLSVHSAVLRFLGKNRESRAPAVEAK